MGRGGEAEPDYRRAQMKNSRRAGLRARLGCMLKANLSARSGRVGPGPRAGSPFKKVDKKARLSKGAEMIPQTIPS